MASFGKVLDLLDDRYLDLQDVIDNVEPLPTLVPYEEYAQNVLVYRMDTNHEIFMALIQDFTERTAQETGKELWTWCVQWEVEDGTSDRFSAPAHSPKKPRLDLDLPDAPSNAPQPQRRAHAFDIVERRVIDPELMQEEDMLRILIDIIQVDSSIVPNFIEFLYRWIDFYEGDGKALKAALRHEIPSLWDFEYHPLILPADLKKKQAEQEKAIKAEANDAIKDSEKDVAVNKTPNNRKAEELAQGSPTKKMREKPDLAAIERQTAESERLQYREVKYGIQPPKMSEPLPPLINIPRDQKKRTKYYAACFRSRQRALNLLVEAGITIPQISNYKKLQEAHPRDTPLGGEGNGLRHYHKDAQSAQVRYAEKEKEMALREKYMEIAISNKLAAEAQLAARSAHPEGSSGVPLIPPTPSYANRRDLTSTMLDSIQAARGKDYDKINVVPTPLVGRMKSKIFENARDRQTWNVLLARPGGILYPPRPVQIEESDDDDEDGTDTDDDSEDGRDNDSYRLSMNAPPPHPTPSTAPSPGNLLPPSLPFPVPPPRPLQAPVLPGAAQSPGAYAPPPQHNGASAPRATTSNTPIPGSVTEYMRNLSPEQAQRLVPLLSSRARQALANSVGVQPPGFAAQPSASNFPFASNATLSATATVPSAPVSPSVSRPHVSLPRPPSSAPTAHEIPRASLSALPPIPLLPPRAVSAATDLATTETQPPGPIQPYLPPPPRLPTITVSAPQSPASQSQSQLPRGFEGYQGPISAIDRLSSSVHGSMWSQPASIQQHQPTLQQQNVSRPYLPQLPPLPPLPTAPGLSAPVPPPAFAQRLLAIQERQNATSQTILPSTINTSIAQPPQSQFSQFSPLPFSLTPPEFGFSPPRPGIQRNVPSPLNLDPMPPPPSPLSSLAPILLATSPFAASAHGIPIQIYLPKIVVPGNTLGPGGAKLGDGGIAETDALLVGYSKPGSGKIVISKAIFLPVGVWTNTLRRVRRGAYTVLETYAVPATHPKLAAKAPFRMFGAAPNSGSKTEDGPNPHRLIYSKIAQVYALVSSSKNREQELTKRWRVTKGPMTRVDRGAVWEGWAAVLDRGIEMSAQERLGAVVSSDLIDEGVEKKKGRDGDEEERERRRKEMEELMDVDEDEDGDTDEEMRDALGT